MLSPMLWGTFVQSIDLRRLTHSLTCAGFSGAVVTTFGLFLRLDCDWTRLKDVGVEESPSTASVDGVAVFGVCRRLRYGRLVKEPLFFPAAGR